MNRQSASALGGTDRLITLDALRGLAVMGILGMNIVAFSMPEWAYVTPLAYGGDTPADRLAWLLSFVLVDGKMRGLFSLLFGASMMLVIDRAAAGGHSPAAVHFNRMAWLAVFGLAHFFLLWFGDILFLYAVVGAVAYRFHRWDPRRLVKWALILFGFGVLIASLMYGSILSIQIMATAPNAPADVVSAYRAIMDGDDMAMDPAREIAAYGLGSYADAVAYRLDDWTRLPATVLMTFLETLPMMMLGMALFKTGFLTGALDTAHYRRRVVQWLIPGLVLNAMVGWIVWTSGFDLIVALNAFMAWSMVPRLLMTLGYAALFILIIRALAGGALMARVTAAGRAAFTNYLGTSVVMTTIFYGYGLGLYGEVGRAEAWLFVVAMWAVMLAWSKPWLDHFHYGPLEWLWRSLARRQMQPFRRPAIATVSQ